MATILIVDDLPANRKFLVTLLRYEGHRLLEAADGREGLAAVHSEHPDLVISDVLMPMMDGYEFIRQLRLDPTTSEIPVVFCTAHYGQREARALALSSGVSYVLTKPVEAEEVLRVVGRALSGETETGIPPDAGPLTTEFDREHLRLVTDKLSQKAGDLRAANARLRALINIGLELGSERDSDRRLERVCASARDLFGATYVTLGILDRNDRTVQHFVACGLDAANWLKTGDAVSGILGTAIAERRPMRGNNPGGDPARLQLPLRHPDVEAFLAAPIVSPDQVYGWICLVGNDGKAFSEDDEDLVMALAGQVGRVYENGYFYDVAQKRAEELEHEILERQRAESAVRHERDRTQRYLDAAEVILLALDMDGRITLVNRYACSVLGWTAEELLDCDWFETCVSVEMRDEVRKKFQSLVGGDLFEHPILTRSGEERLIGWRNTALRDEAGHIIGTLSSGTDNTVRQQAEEERTKLDQRLRDQQFYTRSLIESNIDALMTTDPRGIITDVNKQTEALTGCTRDELIGAPFKNYFTDSDRAEAGINRVLDEGTVINYELTARARDGMQTVVSYNATTFHDRDRKLQGVFAAARDMTDLIRFERALQHKNLELETASRMKSEFLANMSHELRTPLNAIIGFSEVLRDGLVGEMSDRQGGFISSIFTSGTHLLSLINDILDLSKVEAGEMALDLEPVLVSSLLANSLSIVREKAATRHIRLDMDVPEELLGSIQVDARKVTQILYNLLSNAVKFTNDGGQVTLQVGRVQCREVGQLAGPWTGRSLPFAGNEFAEFLKIGVTDNGIGMSPEGLERLFKPFTQIDSGLARKFEGTGLGLVMVEHLAALHGGAVAVESAVGEGSRFTVWLPLRMAEEAALTSVQGPAAARLEPPAGSGCHADGRRPLQVRELIKIAGVDETS